jgi:hypothetical protein
LQPQQNFTKLWKNFRQIIRISMKFAQIAKPQRYFPLNTSHLTKTDKISRQYIWKIQVAPRLHGHPIASKSEAGTNGLHGFMWHIYFILREPNDGGRDESVWVRGAPIIVAKWSRNE